MFINTEGHIFLNAQQRDIYFCIKATNVFSNNNLKF